MESEGFQALTELRQTAADDAYFVTAAALVKKSVKIMMGCMLAGLKGGQQK